MTTLTLHIQDRLLDQVLAVLGQFNGSEVEVVNQDAVFLTQREKCRIYQLK